MDAKVQESRSKNRSFVPFVEKNSQNFKQAYRIENFEKKYHIFFCFAGQNANSVEQKVQNQGKKDRLVEQHMVICELSLIGVFHSMRLQKKMCSFEREIKVKKCM